MLRVSDLSISIGSPDNYIDIVSSVSFEIGRGEILGLVGESGCGKSMTSLAVMGLLAKGGPWVRTGRAELSGFDVIHAEPYERVEAGHGGIAMIFQEPMSSLNPVMTIGEQIEEAINVHQRVTGSRQNLTARDYLEMVRIADAAMQINAYPHQLSGGMRQRVMIAIALACQPQVLIADEPTTALDVTVQAQILSLLRELCDTLGLSILFITHDLGVVAQLVDRVAVMYAGRVVETAAVDRVFDAAAHPYTAALMSCLPDPAHRVRRLVTIPGQAAKPGQITKGCAFAPRCAYAVDICREDPLPYAMLADNHRALCLFPRGVVR
ncbi:MAG: ABC transporter ATP-binding protein [Pseudolabrys sp.]|nr:ABC transporter ATP-binding protein [Pseudolabrys sp.]